MSTVLEDLWHAESRSWNTHRVWELYGQDLGEKICILPIGDENYNNRMAWFHNSSREYTSKSAYSWLLLKHIGFGPHSQGCPGCGAELETFVHALKDCLISKVTLMISSLDSSILTKEYDRGIALLEDMLRILDKKVMADFMTTL
ncbi:hypothetical protein J1N35_038591 [Gossypium stocksii]|uniref:Reverse transcriptase zinc-binding domain-containing protein n=1 Tax=Gossypium stocksii TaxID=47602 RepID=A0A9D3ZMW6_9ROSI|nr:hypothetical protein J1N35_038591 [Gossypium stocksii]